MIGSTLEATHKTKQVLILAVFNGTPLPKALVLHTTGTLDFVSINELSVNWHWDEKKGWEPDFEPEP